MDLTLTVRQEILRRPWFWHIEPTVETATRKDSDGGFEFLFGLALVAVAPALFWPTAIKLASLLIGFEVSWLTLGLISGGIFSFLGTVYAVVARRG